MLRETREIITDEYKGDELFVIIDGVQNRDEGVMLYRICSVRV